MKEIRLLDDLGYGDRALSKGDVLSTGTGKDAVDAKTAASWVRAGLAISTDPADAPNAPAPRRSKVVVHERGGMELLQAASTVGEGPAPENPTDSDPEEDAEDGAARTAAGAVIAENADPEPVADEKATKSSKSKGKK